MKRALVLLIVLAAVTIVVLKPSWLPRLDADPIYLGYVEGETALIAAPTAGRLTARPVERGQSIAAGTLLFQIDPAPPQAQIAQAEAVLAQSNAQLQNLLTGKRDLEQQIVRAQRREAEAAYTLAARELSRVTQLTATGAASRAALDQARSTFDQANARNEELKALEQTGDLPARDQDIAAARANVAAQTAALAQARLRLSDLAPTAPTAALVENTFYDTGEFVPAGQPVVSLLAPDKIKLRFFVPQTDIARARIGGRISFRCDGCTAPMAATISYISPRSEFTPPVIYSDAARQKLVFMLEARPDAAGLHPGLPVEILPLP